MRAIPAGGGHDPVQAATHPHTGAGILTEHAHLRVSVGEDATAQGVLGDGGGAVVDGVVDVLLQRDPALVADGLSPLAGRLRPRRTGRGQHVLRVALQVRAHTEHERVDGAPEVELGAGGPRTVPVVVEGCGGVQDHLGFGGGQGAVGGGVGVVPLLVEAVIDAWLVDDEAHSG